MIVTVATVPGLIVDGLTVSELKVGGFVVFWVKVAVGLRLLFMTMLQGLPPLQKPLHAENVQPLAGVAFMVTVVPGG